MAGQRLGHEGIAQFGLQFHGEHRLFGHGLPSFNTYEHYQYVVSI
jgi:hypothetical protein